MSPSSNAEEIEALKERNRYLSRLIDASNDGFWDWHIPSGHVRFGGKWGAMLGYAIDEFEPSFATWKNLVHPDDLELVQNVLQEHLEGRTSHYQTEHRLRTRSGNWRWILDRGRVVERDENGNPIRACGAHIDITGKKELELERERIAAEREQLLGMASHELKNPMQAIVIGIETIEKTFPTELGKELIPRALDGIRNAMHRMKRLISDLLDTTQIEGGRVLLVKQNTTWMELIAQALQGLEPVLGEKRPKLVYQGQLDLEVNVDVDRMVQVLTNLLSNAMKFSAFGSEIHIESQSSSERTTLRIRDFGPGIPKLDHEHVFMRFWQGRETAWQGTGLGLYIAKGLVEAHGGTLRVSDTQGLGTTLELCLPLESQAPQPIQA